MNLLKFILYSTFILIVIIGCKKNKTTEINTAYLKLSKKNIIIKNVEKKTLWKVHYIHGQKQVSSYLLKYISADLLEKEYNNNIIISIDLYLDFNNLRTKTWNVNKNNIKNIGIYYLKDNRIMFDYFELPKANIIFNAKKLSDVYCDAIIPFLFDNLNLNKEKLSLITFTINSSERPNFKTLDLSTKEKDIVYRKLKKTVNKYIKNSP
ncbi:hypothetical protein [uncultured Polaribacter sp.]|jgi:hypothetical protein|uniref:hypothetical protein n=1 Tax=uncultured Polaribacter sp. TaxID=174711 RepID=UPI003704C384|tara:strand:- start:52 stop:675 length:624 start_codon:yes stop_codon:yes gene_type:complete